ncbi:MAG: hypothetical protein ACFFBD_26865 [Candidatus Hodarchaeota archaeon]
MFITKTVQIQLVSHRQPLKETLDRFVEALNFASQYAHQFNIFGATQLQQHIYQTVRTQFGLKLLQRGGVYASGKSYRNGYS